MFLRKKILDFLSFDARKNVCKMFMWIKKKTVFVHVSSRNLRENIFLFCHLFFARLHMERKCLLDSPEFRHFWFFFMWEMLRWNVTWHFLTFFLTSTHGKKTSVFKKLFHLFQQSQLINLCKIFLFSTLLFLGAFVRQLFFCRLNIRWSSWRG